MPDNETVPEGAAPPAAAAADAGMPPEEVRSSLNLPPDAPDEAVIQTLVKIVSNLQSSYEELLSQQVKTEEVVANREFAPFVASIPEGEHSFWLSNLLVNREPTLATLKRQFSGVGDASARPPIAPAAGRLPLVNRATAVPAPVGVLAALGPDAAIAAKIRNRADELMKTGKADYRLAFDQAAKELK